MKKLILILPILMTTGCASNMHKSLKSPCSGKYAAFSKNPCNPIPINIACSLTKSKDVSS